MPTKDGLYYAPFEGSEKFAGRYCHLLGLTEVTDLLPGTDFRNPQYRREVWFRFYHFHLKHRSHPGCVYYALPYLEYRLCMNIEQKLWFAFINGNTQNPVTTYKIFQQFPELETLQIWDLTDWYNANWTKLGWDTDRRHAKKDFIKAVTVYKALVQEFGTQLNLFKSTGYKFADLWKLVRNRFHSFGRLSAFSYLEYLRISGLPITCDTLFLDDMDGSKSHRNGLAKVLGRDDLDWYREYPFTGNYTDKQMLWLETEAELLLKEAQARFAGYSFADDVTYFTMESALCTFKSWFRNNRRYPNVYNDMFHDRIVTATKKTGDANDLFWEMREQSVPEHLRLEKCPRDPGLAPVKQNHFRNTGQVIMMHREWDCFSNDFNAKYS